ncbi:hypothetical protein CWR45_18235 [Oceanobacillus chungangensis]|uniref:Uncharacterized protein n=2 Tax=Oceanobacillus chungangensis TaxID=1229152 RepID=A0A3D8PIP3_9BACI|nr:hypothetical protein CWR45_18235 [Oceanobacillus chungangensis]
MVLLFVYDNIFKEYIIFKMESCFMKRKLGLGFIGIFALSTGFTDVLATGQVDVSDRDKIRVVTVEEQEVRENKAIEGKDLEIIIIADEQNMVENSSNLSGFVPQENGRGLYFEKKQTNIQLLNYHESLHPKILKKTKIN